MMAFQPVSFQTLAKATMPQKYLGYAKKLSSVSKIPRLTSSSLTMPEVDSASCRMPVTMIQDRKCGR